jgi:hypothetical protein
VSCLPTRASLQAWLDVLLARPPLQQRDAAVTPAKSRGGAGSRAAAMPQPADDGVRWHAYHLPCLCAAAEPHQLLGRPGNNMAGEARCTRGRVGTHISAGGGLCQREALVDSAVQSRGLGMTGRPTRCPTFLNKMDGSGRLAATPPEDCPQSSRPSRHPCTPQQRRLQPAPRCLALQRTSLCGCRRSCCPLPRCRSHCASSRLQAHRRLRVCALAVCAAQLRAHHAIRWAAPARSWLYCNASSFRGQSGTSAAARRLSCRRSAVSCE